MYLVILKAMHGIKPKAGLLERYHLEQEFSRLISAVFSGNVFYFREAMNTCQEFYIKMEVYLLIQLKLKTILYRNLFKRVYFILNGGGNGEESAMKMDSAASGRLPLTLLEQLMTQGLAISTDVDELECIMINK